MLSRIRLGKESHPTSLHPSALSMVSPKAAATGNTLCFQKIKMAKICFLTQ